ncbi:MAG: 3-keto-disaccharide hydrolase [Thermoguttaceae bacterium]|jgi:hypothetical protein
MNNKILLLTLAALVLSAGNALYAADSEPTTAVELESSLRAKVVDYMRAAASIEWTPTEDIPYWNPEQSFSFKKGETYYGIPYTQFSRNNNLDSFKAQLNTIDGATYYVGPSEFDNYKGSDCSASVSNAWKHADPEFPSLLTRRMIPDRPKEVVAVGKYDLNHYDSTPKIVKENGFETMKAAYSQLKPGDAVLMHYDYDGHVMLVLQNEPENSRLYIADQTGLANGAPKGRDGHSTFRLDYEFTYEKLFDDGYIPIALKKIDDATHEIQLFNGKDLEGWDVWIRGADAPNIDPKNVFTVQDGILRVSGEEYGGIQTIGSYSNYRLTVEFKWGEKTYGNKIGRARDSGVLIHSFGEIGGFGGVWSKSVEANVIEGGTGDFWIVGGPDDGISATCDVVEIDGQFFFDPKNGKPTTITANADGNFQRLGKNPSWDNTTGFFAIGDFEKQGDWNELVIYAVGDEMQIYLNGKFVNRIYGLKQTEGKIQLQSEGAEIFYRRVSLRPWDEPLD